MDKKKLQKGDLVMVRGKHSSAINLFAGDKAHIIGLGIPLLYLGQETFIGMFGQKHKRDLFLHCGKVCTWQGGSMYTVNDYFKLVYRTKKRTHR